MPHQTSFLWRVDGAITSVKFRASMAAAVTKLGIPLDPMVFWYSANGKPIHQARIEKNLDRPYHVREKKPVTEADKALGVKRSGPKNEAELSNNQRALDMAMPMVRFFQHGPFVGIHFIGLEAQAVAAAQAINLVRLAAAVIPGALLQVQETAVSCGGLAYPVEYVCPWVALKNPNFDFLGEKGYLQRIIAQDIRRQAAIIGADVPSNLEILVTEIESTSVGYTDESKKVIRHPGSKLIKGVHFKSNVELKGSWSFGSLTSRGYGAAFDKVAHRGVDRSAREMSRAVAA